MIGPNDYKYISDRVGINYNFNEKIRDRLLDSLNYLRSSTQYELTQDGFVSAMLESEISNTLYKYVIVDRVDEPLLLLDLVTALQKHITIHYGDVNNFLSDNTMKVNENFAGLSAIAGYTINPGNIE